jgi:hypothetical protein
MTSPSELGYFFGFDGTDNLVVGAAHPTTKVLWVSDSTIARHLSFPTTAEAVRTTIAWQRDVVEQVRSGALNINPPQADLTALTKALDVVNRPDHEDDENGTFRAAVGRDRIASAVGLERTAGIESVVERVDALRRDRIAAELRAHELADFAALARELLEAPDARGVELASRLEQLRADRIEWESAAQHANAYLRATAALLGAPDGEPAELLERLTNLARDRTQWESAARNAHGELAAAEFRAQEGHAYLRASAEILGAPDGEPPELLERLTNLARDRVEWEQRANAALAKRRSVLWPFTTPIRWLASRWARPGATIAQAR